MLIHIHGHASLMCSHLFAIILPSSSLSFPNFDTLLYHNSSWRVCVCVCTHVTFVPYPVDVPPTSDAAEKKEEFSAPPAEEKSDIQLEPTQEEMERERLTSKAEQVKKRMKNR